MDFGATIRRARESRGMTASQLAAQTRILPQTVVDMENNKFDRIPAPIYGRGFVKLICEYLDLDPVTMVPAFMAAYNGEPQIDDGPEPERTGPAIISAQPPMASESAPIAEAIQEPAAETPTAEPAAPQPSDEPLPEPPKAALDNSLKGLELFDPSVAIKSAPVQQPPLSSAPAEPALSGFQKPAEDDGILRFQQPSAETDFSRFATPMPGDDKPSISPLERFRESLSSVSSGVLGQMKSIPRPAFRIALLAAALLLVLGMCGWGIVALFHATSSSGDEASAQQQAEFAETKASAAQNTTGQRKAQPAGNQGASNATKASGAQVRASTPLKLPGFYID